MNKRASPLIKGIILVGMLIGALMANQFLFTGYRSIRLHNVYDQNDYLDFLIPAHLPDFVNTFKDSTMCMGAGMFQVACIWHDGTKAEDGSIPNAHWYTMYFWIGTKVSQAVPIALEIDDDTDLNSDAWYLYNETGEPIQCSEYEYHMFFFDMNGVPRISEEEFYEKQRIAKEEWDKYLKERKEEEQREKDKEAGIQNTGFIQIKYRE